MRQNNFVTYSFSISPQLNFDFSKGHNGQNTVFVGVKIEAPGLFHEHATLLCKVLVPKHVTDPKIMYFLPVFLLFLAQLSSLTQPQRTIADNAEEVYGLSPPADHLSFFKLKNFEHQKHFLYVSLAVPVENAGFRL